VFCIRSSFLSPIDRHLGGGTLLRRRHANCHRISRRRRNLDGGLARWRLDSLALAFRSGMRIDDATSELVGECFAYPAVAGKQQSLFAAAPPLTPPPRRVLDVLLPPAVLHTPWRFMWNRVVPFGSPCCTWNTQVCPSSQYQPEGAGVRTLFVPIDDKETLRLAHAAAPLGGRDDAPARRSAGAAGAARRVDAAAASQPDFSPTEFWPRAPHGGPRWSPERRTVSMPRTWKRRRRLTRG
jgi:hypothetical protein